MTRRRVVVGVSLALLAAPLLPLLHPGVASRAFTKLERWRQGWKRLELSKDQVLTTKAGGRLIALCDLDEELPPPLAKDLAAALEGRPGEHFIFAGRVPGWQVRSWEQEPTPNRPISADEYLDIRHSEGEGVVLVLGTRGRAEFVRAFTLAIDEQERVALTLFEPIARYVERFEAKFGRGEVQGASASEWTRPVAARVRYIRDPDGSFTFLVLKTDHEAVVELVKAP